MLLRRLAGPGLARSSRDGYVLESSVVCSISGELLDSFALSVCLLDLPIQRVAVFPARF